MEKNQDLKIPYKFDSRFVFEDSLARIFRLISEIKSLEEIISNTKLPFIFTDDDSLPINFDYNLQEISAYESYKEISWLLICKVIKTPIKISFNLTENTLENTVLVVFEISIVKRDLIPDKYKYKIITSFEGIAVEVLNNIIIKLQKDKKDIYHYESKVFNYSRDKISSVIFDLNEIMKEKGVISSITRVGEKNKVGEIISLILLDEQKEVKVKINEIDLDEQNIKWRITYIPLDDNYKDYLVEWAIIKINDKKTMVIINNIYNEQIDGMTMNKLTDTKKNLFKIIDEEFIKRYPSN